MWGREGAREGATEEITLQSVASTPSVLALFKIFPFAGHPAP